MRLAVSDNLRYWAGVRLFVTLFAVMVIFLSAIHAGPVGAHDSDPAHTSAHTADHDHDDGSGGEDPLGDELHEGHHHCPGAAAPDHGVVVAAGYFASSRFLPPNMSRLASTTLAPLLAPPKV